MKTRPMQVTAWDGTELLANHDRPGPTRIHRFGEQLDGMVSVEEQLLVPADMDPRSQWLVDAGTDPHPACHRWEVWSDGGMLLDLVHTPVDDWTHRRVDRGR